MYNVSVYIVLMYHLNNSGWRKTNLSLSYKSPYFLRRYVLIITAGRDKSVIKTIPAVVKCNKVGHVSPTPGLFRPTHGLAE